jgi:hypothetical protein
MFSLDENDVCEKIRRCEISLVGAKLFNVIGSRL